MSGVVDTLTGVTDIGTGSATEASSGQSMPKRPRLQFDDLQLDKIRVAKRVSVDADSRSVKKIRFKDELSARSNIVVANDAPT